jgi:transposase-like protein
MSKRQIKRFETGFKVKVVLEALKEELTLNELAAKYKTIPRNIVNWKKDFLVNAELVFDKEKAVAQYKEELGEKGRQIDELHRQLGKTTTQLEWCKKKSKELGLEYEAPVS